VTIVGDKVVWDTRGLGCWCGWTWLSYRSNGGHSRYSRFKAACSPSIGVCPSEEPLSNESVDYQLRHCHSNVSKNSVPKVEELQGQLKESVHSCVWKYRTRAATGMTVKRDNSRSSLCRRQPHVDDGSWCSSATQCSFSARPTSKVSLRA
jgi:hypothetical protein